MPQETGTQILSYQPNSAIGLGDVAIPAIDPKADLSVINDTLKNVMLLDNANNVMKYQQKIKDRDEMYKAFSEGQAATGDILEEDRQMVNEYKKLHYDAFRSMLDNGGLNNHEAAIEYKRRTQDLTDAVVHAQGRFTMIQTERKSKGEDTSPKRQKARQDNIDKNLAKDFWAEITPYQQMYSLDHQGLSDFLLKGAVAPNSGVTQPVPQTTKTVTKTVNGKPTQVTVTVAPPPTSAAKAGTTGTGKAGKNVPQGTPSLSLFDRVPGSSYEYKNILNNAIDGYAHDEDRRIDMNELLNQFQTNLEYDDLKKFFKSGQQRLDQYNEQKGIKGTADEVKFDYDDDGTTITIKDDPKEFASKVELSKVAGDYVQEDTFSFSKEKADYKIGKERADTDAYYKRLLGQKLGAQIRSINQQIRHKETAQQKEKLITDLWKDNFISQESLTHSVPSIVPGRGGFALNRIPYNKTIAVLTIDDGGKPIRLLPKGVVYDAKAKKYVPDVKWQKLHGEIGYDQHIMDDKGKQLPLKNVAADYEFYKKTGWTVLRKAGIEPPASFDEYLKFGIETGMYQVILEGLNGSTNEKYNSSALKAINNMYDKNKDQEPIIDYEIQDVPITDETETKKTETEKVPVAP